MMLGGGGGNGEGMNMNMNMMAGLPLQLNPVASGSSASSQQQQQQQQMWAGSSKEERVVQPQWSPQETRELIGIRADLERDFTAARRNRALWEAVAARMRERGYRRTPDQCKCKWKNLVTRFKGSEATEGEGSRQFPFYEEMRTIFSERMGRLLALNKDKGKGVQVQGEEWGGEEEEEEEEEEQKVGEGKKKRKVERPKRVFEGEVENALREFARRQLEMEARWIEAVEAREAERRAKEEEWRRVMEALEEERKAMERRWREREEERREREEARAERRDALVTALLDKLAKDEL